jgi:hypothetical protein
MQIGKWMSYSDSSHFSDKLSYKILFILSYRLKDIYLARFKHLQEILEKQRMQRDFSHREPDSHSN